MSESPSLTAALIGEARVGKSTFAGLFHMAGRDYAIERKFCQFAPSTATFKFVQEVELKLRSGSFPDPGVMNSPAPEIQFEIRFEEKLFDRLLFNPKHIDLRFHDIAGTNIMKLEDFIGPAYSPLNLLRTLESLIGNEKALIMPIFDADILLFALNSADVFLNGTSRAAQVSLNYARLLSLIMDYRKEINRPVTAVYGVLTQFDRVTSTSEPGIVTPLQEEDLNQWQDDIRDRIKTLIPDFLVGMENTGSMVHHKYLFPVWIDSEPIIPVPATTERSLKSEHVAGASEELRSPKEQFEFKVRTDPFGYSRQTLFWFLTTLASLKVKK